jgi:hypothetical protein
MPARRLTRRILVCLPALLLATLAALTAFLLLSDPYESTGTIDRSSTTTLSL